MRDVGSRITNVAVHLAHNTDVLIAVQEGVFLIALAGSAVAVRGFVGLETRVGEHDDEAFAVLVRRGNRSMLLRNELRELWWGERLGSCHYDGDQHDAQNYVE